MTVRTEVVTITPYEAERMLEGNTNNRSVRAKAVQRLARDMAAGKWIVNGESIKFNGASLLDGQHRLLACVEAGVPFTTLVVYGLDIDAKVTVDTGTPRTLGDTLKWRGEVDQNGLAATLTLVLGYKTGTILQATRPTTQESIAFLDRNPTIRDAAARGRLLKDHLKFGPQSAYAAALFLASELDGVDAADFFGGLETQAMLPEGDSRIAFVRWATNATRTPHVRLTNVDWLAHLIKAWNAYRGSVPVKTLKWARVGKNREQFPEIR